MRTFPDSRQAPQKRTHSGGLQPNNFDIMRLVLALTVVVAHCRILSQSASLGAIDALNPEIAVDGFFAISGFLVVASYERSSSMRQYFAKRARRILPGYWLSTIVCVLIAIAFTHSFHVWGFLLANLTFMNFLHPGIPGLFSSNFLPAVNGALWTIKEELSFYVCVPFIVWLCRKYGHDIILPILIVLSIVYRQMTVGPISHQLPAQLAYFLTGTLLYYHLSWFKRRGLWVVAAAALAYIIYSFTGWIFLQPCSLSVLTIGACYLLPHFEGPAKWGDFSYGAYVLHFPIIQSLVALGLFTYDPWVALITVLVLVSVSAVLSWKFVESPFLKSRLRKISAGEAVTNRKAVVSD